MTTISPDAKWRCGPKHAKPSGETESQVQMSEHIYWHLAADWYYIYILGNKKSSTIMQSTSLAYKSLIVTRYNMH